MATEFLIPKHEPKSVLGESSCNAPVADIIDDLNEHDALYITQQDAYDSCEELARGFLQLTPRERSQTVDVLAANLRYICTSAQQLLAGDDNPSPDVLQRHRNGMKMILHLLHIIAVQAQKNAEQAKGAENAAAKPAKATGRGRKAAAASDGPEWDWQHSRQQVLQAVHDVMRQDLRTLFKGLAPAARMVNICMELALQALESPAVTKQEGSWLACCDVLVRGAVQHEQLDFVAAALMDRARKHEHVPPLAAQAAKYAEEKYNSTQLAVKLLAEFWASSPEDYDSQYTNNAKSVRQAGEVVAALAELLPKVVSNHISQLRPYLACSKASSIRGALMGATGSILLQVFPTDALSSSLGAGAAQAHLRSKEALLALLHARILDKAAYVRQKVLQTWARLVEESCVPLSHWNTLLAQAISRLEDESQLVVRAALQLLHKMLHQGIFQPPLNAQVYINTLRQAEAELEALMPAGGRHKARNLGEGRRGSDNGGDTSDEDQSGAEDGDQAGAWDQGDIKVEEGVEDVTMQDQKQDPEEGSDSSNANNAAAITRLRTMVASLKEGASFCKRLAASLQQVQVLLASRQASVVHDAIVFLTMCKTYEVTGAAKALRGMWALVFSKEEAVRDAVLDSWNILHLHDKGPKEQLPELVQNVVPGCTLAELTALEAILKALTQRGGLSAPVLTHLLIQDICHYYTKLREQPHIHGASNGREQGPPGTGSQSAALHTAMDADGPAEAAAPSRADFIQQLRHAFTLLSLLSAAQPSVVKAMYVPVLLEVGFSPDLADAWVARNTCLTLRYAAPVITGQLSMTAGAATAAAVASNTATDPVSPETHQAMLSALVRLLVAPPAASMEANWPSAAEAAVAAVYAVSARPQELMAAVLEEMFRRCRPGAMATGATELPENQQAQPLEGFSAAALSRFFFVLGRTAVQHLLCIEQLGKALRQTRLAAGRLAAEAAEKAREAGAVSKAAGRKSSAKVAAAAAQQQQADDIAGMLGAGAVTADAELDDLVDMIEAQILSKDQLLGRYGGLLSKMVHLRAFISYPQELQASALLALTQLMAVDGVYCSDNVAVLFTLLHKRLVSAPVRVNIVVALADLASRFPNVLEPWTAYMYEPLEDPEPSVKLSALSSLTHLVLGGMVKAKGNVAKVAMLLVDDCEELVDRAVLFFEELASSGSGSSRSAGSAAAGASAANPVYNLLPDALSALLAKDDPPLRDEHMQVIMTQLLSYVKDKQAESLRERLVVRLQLGGPREWRLVAWCIGQLGYSEKGLRRIMEMAACYRHTLGEQQVFDVFMSLARKATGSKAVSAAAASASAGGSSSASGLPGDFKSAVEEWVADLAAAREAALEAAEVEAMAAARQQQQEEAEQDGASGAAQPGAAAGMQHSNSEGQQQEGLNEDADMADLDGQQQTAAVTATGAVDKDPEGEQAQQLVLVQSQDIKGQDDLEPALLEAAAAAVATAGMQRMSLAGGGIRPASAATVSRGRGTSRASSAAAAGSTAALKQPSRGAAAGAGRGTKQQQLSTAAKRGGGRRNAANSPSSSSSEGDDDDSASEEQDSSDGMASSSSDDDVSVAAAGTAAVSNSRASSKVRASTAAARGAAAGRATSGSSSSRASGAGASRTGGRAAGAVTTQTAPKAAVAQRPCLAADSSSEDDD